MTETVQTGSASNVVECDLLVIGGGAAGLSAAVTAAYHGLNVIVAEKAHVLGGATAWSGGWMWAPLNPLSPGRRDRRGHRRAAHLPQARAGRELRRAAGGGACCRTPGTWSRSSRSTPRCSSSVGSWIADIQGDLPGAGTGGRSVGPKPFNARRLRKDLRQLVRPQLYETSFLGMGIMAGPDLQAFLHAMTSVKSSSTPPGGSRSTCWT